MVVGCTRQDSLTVAVSARFREMIDIELTDCQAKAARGSLSSHLLRYPIEASAHIVDRSFTEAPKDHYDSPHFLMSPYSAY
jgi:hypothetical protein